MRRHNHKYEFRNIIQQTINKATIKKHCFPNLKVQIKYIGKKEGEKYINIKFSREI